MPGMNGFETAVQIRPIAPTTRIIFLSVHDIPNTARWVGGDAFVSKSATSEELFLAVNHVLESDEHAQPDQKSISATLGT
jgi:DNA-binding NarL/FixJ family response regulator